MRAFTNQIRTSNPTFGLKGQGRTALTYTISANTLYAVLSPKGMPGYVAGKTDLTVVVNSGIYIYSDNIAIPALSLGAINSGDTVQIINNGFILGKGGAVNTGAGGLAISLGSATTINNTNASAYIGGGGGGGGVGGGAGYCGGGTGGGGAGGGNGVYNAPTPGGTGGVGVGGRIIPGSGSAAQTAGAGAGAGGYNSAGGAGGAGGSGANNGSGGNSIGGGGGGGGWGASGGSGGTSCSGGGPGAGGAGGKAVALNTFAVTWVSSDTTRVYGAIS